MKADNENKASENSTNRLGGFFSLALSGVLFFAVHVFLLDCAIETHLAQSPLRWWVTVSVAIYFALLTAVYWRAGSSRAVGLLRPGALIGTVVLIALICLSSLHTAGLSDGVRLLGMSTSTVQISITMLGICLFGVLWGLNSQIDYRLRIGGSLIALYGLISFLLGLANGASYTELLQGAAFWTILPSLLQGSVLGSLLFLPFALVHLTVRFIMSDSREALQSWSARTICGALCVLLAIQGFSYGSGPIAPTGMAQAAKNLPPLDRGPMISNASPVEATAEQVIEKFDETTALLEDSAQLFEGIPLTPIEVVEQVGSDPVNLYRWVRDKTAFVAYRGVLRGAEGVLADRDGNALDRSLLLQRLLIVAGHRARLASGTLDTASATQLASNSELSASRLPFSSFEITDTRASNARNRVSIQSEQIMQLLGNSSSGEREKAAVVADIADHWWVQVQNDGQWLDLDMLATGPEKSLTEATATFTEENLPEDLFQQVSIRLHLETRGKKSNHHVLVEISRPATSLAGKTINLAHLPLGVDNDALRSVTSVEATLDIMAGAKAWMPLLSFDGATTRGSLITASGEILEATEANIKRFTKKLSASDRIMNRLQGRQEKPPVAHPPVPYSALVSEWIEIEVFIPGSDQNIVRRVLFDDNERQQKAELVRAEAELVRAEVERIRAEAKRVRAEAEGVRAEAERIYSLWEGEQAELNKKRQVCSEQSGRDLEDLWVLEKDALPEIPEMEDLQMLTELWESDQCLGLSMALASTSPEPAAPSTYDIPSDTPDLPELSDELRASLAIQPAHHRKVAGLLRSIHIATETAKLSGAALTHRLQYKLSRLTKLKSLIEGGDQLNRSRVNEFMPELLTLQTELDYLAYLRWKIHPGGDDLYMAQPGITLVDRSIDKLGEDNWVSTQSIDIAMNPVEVRPGSVESPFNARLAQGVADTVSEALIHPASDLPINMSITHDLTVGYGVGFNRLSPGDRGKVEALDLPQSAKDLLMQDLVAGHDVLVPKQMIDFDTGYASWWRVDTVTGNTLGMMSNGTGGATAPILVSDFIGTIIWIGIILDVYFWADCVTGGQEEVFFFVSIKGADLGNRVALCTFEMVVMNAMFAALLKMLSRHSGSIKSVFADEVKAGNIRSYPWDSGHGVSLEDARKVGMHPDQIDEMERIMDVNDLFAAVRGTNPESLKFHGLPDYVSKNVDIKFKTDSVEGIVKVPSEQSMTKKARDQWKKLQDEGWSIDKERRLLDPDGNRIFGDHDLQGVYDLNGVRALDDELIDMLNDHVFRETGIMIHHGANDDFFVGIFKRVGRRPGANEIYIVFDPKNRMTHIIEGTASLRSFYKNNGLPWIY